jgi:hypothetical protein
MILQICISFILFGLSLSCSHKPDMNQSYAILADKFAHALTEGRFDDAQALLVGDQKKSSSAATLKKQYEEMIAYASGPSAHIEVMQTLDTWPEKQRGEVGWVYVAITGDDFSEAISVVVAQEGDLQGICQIEWGRP